MLSVLCFILILLLTFAGFAKDEKENFLFFSTGCCVFPFDSIPYVCSWRLLRQRRGKKKKEIQTQEYYYTRNIRICLLSNFSFLNVHFFRLFSSIMHVSFYRSSLQSLIFMFFSFLCDSNCCQFGTFTVAFRFVCACVCVDGMKWKCFLIKTDWYAVDSNILMNLLNATRFLSATSMIHWFLS